MPIEQRANAMFRRDAAAHAPEARAGSEPFGWFVRPVRRQAYQRIRRCRLNGCPCQTAVCPVEWRRCQGGMTDNRAASQEVSVSIVTGTRPGLPVRPGGGVTGHVHGAGTVRGSRSRCVGMHMNSMWRGGMPLMRGRFAGRTRSKPHCNKQHDACKVKEQKRPAHPRQMAAGLIVVNAADGASLRDAPAEIVSWHPLAVLGFVHLVGKRSEEWERVEAGQDPRSARAAAQ